MNQVLDKISKTLELGTNNSNENEAQNAILIAQRLMAKYHISQEDIDNFINENDKKDNEVIEESAENEVNNDKWKRQLMLIIARNFRCDLYYKEKRIMIVGEPDDIQIAKRVYLYAKNAILKGFKEYLRKNYNYCNIDDTTKKRYKRDYAYGFVNGLLQKFNEQKADSELAMVVVNQDVKVYMSNLHLGGIKRNKRVYIQNSKSYEQGRIHGKNLVDIDTSVAV